MSLLKKIFLGGSLLLAVSSLLSRGLGVFRDHLLASHFGASAQLDVYYAAFRIPDLIYALLIVSSVSVVFLPLFQKHKVKENWEEAWKFTSKMLNSLVLAFGLFALLVIIFAPTIVKFYVFDFTPVQQEMTVTLLRWMMLSPFFFMLSSIMIAVENAFHQFFAQALAPILYNLGIIGGIYFLSPIYGIQGIAFGVVIGAVLQMLVQVPFFLHTGVKWSPVLLKMKELKEMLALMLPRILSVSTMQIALTVDVIIGSMLAAGSISLLSLAINIQSLPFGMIAISISITSFAQFTKLSAEKNFSALKQCLQENVEKTLFWLMPAIVGLFLVTEPLVKFLFQYGRFDVADTEMLVRLIQILLVALLFQGLIPLLARFFFALQRTWPPFLFSLAGVLVSVPTSYFLSQKIGVQGLAFGALSGIATNALLLMVFTLYNVGKFLRFRFLFFVASLSIFMGALLYYVFIPFVASAPNIVQLLLLSALGGAIYLGTYKVLEKIKIFDFRIKS